VSWLRKVLGSGFELVTRDPGYVLVADPALIDVHQFRELVAAAAQAEDGPAVGMLLTALRLWRGRGSKYIAVLCYHGLGTTLARLGQVGEAEQNLRVAVDLYGIRGQTAEAARAREQLEELLKQQSRA
jgi:hypothetical protein